VIGGEKRGGRLGQRRKERMEEGEESREEKKGDEWKRDKGIEKRKIT
jgi:hypothetical protein